MADIEPTTERWTYLGRRFSRTSKKIFYGWRDEQGVDLFYGKSKATVVGGLYDVKVTRKGGATMHGEPAWTGSTIDSAERGVMQALDRTAYSTQQALAAEKRYAASGPLETACQDLEAMAGKCRSYEDIEALTKAVRQRLMNAWSRA